jgi:hypothetical protein
MKIFNLIQKISSKSTIKISKKSKKLKLLSIKKLNVDSTAMATPTKAIHDMATPMIETNNRNTNNRLVHIFNRINSSIGHYRQIKKRYTISSTTINVSDINIFGFLFFSPSPLTLTCYKHKLVSEIRNESKAFKLDQRKEKI